MDRTSDTLPMAFSKRVALVCDAIPRGRVASYGQIAFLCGYPRAARQVGGALGRGASVNAHRVVNRLGYLSGADAFLISGMQAGLLAAEGVSVSPQGQVNLNQFGWQPTQAEQQKFAALFSGMLES